MDILDFKDIDKDKPVLLLGNGPSLHELGMAPHVKIPTIGIHRSWFALPSKYHIILRNVPRYKEWGNHWDDFIEILPSERPEVIFTSDSRKPKVDFQNLIVVPVKQNSFSFDLTQGSSAFNAGLLALEVAVWLGHNPIYLIGYDMNHNERNFMGGKSAPDESKGKQITLMENAAVKLKDKRDIFNCSSTSRLTCFPKADVTKLFA